MSESLRTVSSRGVRLSVFERGDRVNPVLVFIHGYPDDHAVWNGVVAELSQRYRTICYDVRGSGASDRPPARDDYHLDRLEADFRAVLNSVSPDEPVHLVAHDWGAVQSWHFLANPALQRRIASFTSISGPDLAQAGAWLRATIRSDPRSALRQLRKSGYLVLFQLPLLPELLWRSGLAERGVRRAGGRPDRANGIAGLALYRANLGRSQRRPSASEMPSPPEIPVQVIAPRGDQYVGPQLQFGAPAPYFDNLTTHIVDGGHWALRQNPRPFARLIADFVEQTRNTPAPP